MPDVQSALNRSVEIVKAAYKTCKDREGQQELAEQLMELRESLQVIREAVTELTEERQALKDRVASLEASLVLKAELIRHAGVYWKRDDPEPWCPNCWENHQRAVHLNKSNVLAGRLMECSVCHFDVNMDTLSRPPAKVFNAASSKE